MRDRSPERAGAVHLLGDFVLCGGRVTKWRRGPALAGGGDQMISAVFQIVKRPTTAATTGKIGSGAARRRHDRQRSRRRQETARSSLLAGAGERRARCAYRSMLPYWQCHTRALALSLDKLLINDRGADNGIRRALSA